MVLQFFCVFFSEGNPGLVQSSSCESTELAVKQQEDTSEQKGLNSPETIFKLVSMEQIFSCSLFACVFLLFFLFCFLMTPSLLWHLVPPVLSIFSIWELLATEGSETI